MPPGLHNQAQAGGSQGRLPFLECALMDYVSEIIIGTILGGFAWAFRAWAQTIRETSERILEKLDSLSSEFSKHRLNNAERLTRAETELHHIAERLNRDRPG